MTRTVSRPHLSVYGETVEARPDWWFEVNGIPHTLNDIPRFAQGSVPMTFGSTVKVDVERLFQDTHLDETSTTQVVFIWECPSTRRRDVGARLDLEIGTETYAGTFDIDPELIAGSLRLERQIVLIEPAFHPNPLAARSPGSILWKEPKPLTLNVEGVGGIFPTQLVTFAGSLNAESVWALDINIDELSDPAIAAVRLLLNADHPDVNYLAGHDTRDDRARAVLSTIHWDAGRLLVDAALSRDDLDLEQDWPEDSIGHNLQLIVGAIFPDMSLAAVASLRQRKPRDYQTQLQTGLSLLRGHKYRRYKMTEDPGVDESGAAGAVNPTTLTSDVKQAPSATPEESRASYKQLKFIAGLTGGLWLGTKSLKNHPEFPQDELTREEAHELINELQLIPESQKDRRAELAKRWLRKRANLDP